MKGIILVYFFIAILCSAFPERHERDYKTVLKLSDEYVDKILTNIMEKEGKNYDPYPLDDTVLSFKKKVIFVDINGEAKLTDGYIGGLRNLNRMSSCSLSLQNQRLRIKTKLATEEMHFNFTGSVKILNMGPEIFIHGNASATEVSMEFSYNAATGKEGLLEEFLVKNVKYVNISVSGLRLMKWINDPVVKSATNLFKALIKNLVENKLERLVAQGIIDNKFPVDEFDMDELEIPVANDTTVEPEDNIPEGKRAYTVEEANSYMDTVVENRFQMEASYSKLDPYLLEDIRIDNIFLNDESAQNYVILENGFLEEFSKLKRISDCTRPKWKASNITFICYLGFDRLDIKYSAEAHEDNHTSEFELLVTAQDPRIKIKVTANHIDNVPNMQTFDVKNVGKLIFRASVIIADAPSYGISPYNREVLLKHFTGLLKNAFHGRFKEVLSYSIYKTPIIFLE